MSHPPLVVLVDDDDDAADVEVELSTAEPLEDASAVDVPDSADAVVTPGWVTPPKLDAPPPPPQAERALARARARRVRMGALSLANLLADVMCPFLLRLLSAELRCDDVRPAQDENLRPQRGVEGAQGSPVEG